MRENEKHPLRTEEPKLTFEDFRKEVLDDYRMACISREASLLGRKEVLTGKAKFGIFGDGKEIAQIALSRAFREGDWRSGYYRDQTFMLHAGLTNVKELFAQLYSNTNPEQEPMSAGRQMNAHFATRIISNDGKWLNQMTMKNSSADAAPTASQMPRSLGLAMASKLFRGNEKFPNASNFSNNGNEICFATIGDASTSEGLFWETLNAAGVMHVPLIISVWDDGYGISVPIKFQTTKGSISTITQGFMTDENGNGIDIYQVNGWDYAALIETYELASERTRTTHNPALIHVRELTQPQGHSTSGSHERYKNQERLNWEKDFDGIKKMREWILAAAISSEDSLNEIEKESRQLVHTQKSEAWNDYVTPIKNEALVLAEILNEVGSVSSLREDILSESAALVALREPVRRNLGEASLNVLHLTREENSAARESLVLWRKNFIAENEIRFSSNLNADDSTSAIRVEDVAPVYAENAEVLNGFEILNRFFDSVLQSDARVVAFGEDVGNIGDVNQGFMGLQKKHGEQRVFDTGIREASIIGQGIGLALRGFRPIAEIQYLDYLLFGLQTLSDDLATLRYRTAGAQTAPLIIRTRGHRLEGIWHSGSPMGMILNSLRGIHVCVPRNMTQAAGFYSTLLSADEPGLIIECLNGYRLKEKLPSNLSMIKTPLGIPEIIHEGIDVTVVTYGSCIRIAQEAMHKLSEANISVELIDVQTLLPFDVHHSIVESLKKTNRILFFDEDVPGGASAYMMQQVIENQGGFRWLDAAPKTLSAKAHRPAYASDGDYFSKPSADDFYLAVYSLMHEAEPGYFPEVF